MVLLHFEEASGMLQGRTNANLGMIGSISLILEQNELYNLKKNWQSAFGSPLECSGFVVICLQN